MAKLWVVNWAQNFTFVASNSISAILDLHWKLYSLYKSNCYFFLICFIVETKLNLNPSISIGIRSICWSIIIKQINKWICCTLKSGLHEIPTMIRTFPHGLENNYACKWIFDNFPGLLTYVLFMENCLKSICMHCCSSIHVERFFSSSLSM